MLVCDDKIAIIGGFNIAPEYLTGDGINKGWRDLGVELTGRLVHGLANAFDDMASLERRYNSNFTSTARSHPLAAQIDGWSSVSGGSVYASFVAAQLRLDAGARTNTFEDLITSGWVKLGTRQLGGVAAFSYLWGYAPVMDPIRFN